MSENQQNIELMNETNIDMEQTKDKIEDNYKSGVDELVDPTEEDIDELLSNQEEETNEVGRDGNSFHIDENMEQTFNEPNIDPEVDLNLTESTEK